MTPFSSALDFYMKEKKIKTYSIAQFCGMDRSNMYKIISGKRNPGSEELVQRIAEYMRLKPMEKNHLIEAYQITVMGYDTWHRRKSVQEFLISFSDYTSEKCACVPDHEYMSVNVDEQELIRRQGIIMTEGRLKDMVLSVLNLESRKPDGKISLLLQPENSLFMEVMSSIGVKEPDLQVEHIFCLSNTDDITADKRDYNLTCLKCILPMFTRCICDYRPFCYYDNIVSRNNKFNLLSSMILTSEYAILFSAEDNYGMLLSQKSTVLYLQTLFQSLKEDAISMACKMDTLEKQLDSFESISFHDEGVSFQPEACLLPILPRSFLEKYVNMEHLSRKCLQERLYRYVIRIGEMAGTSNTRFIFTENGIRRFLRSGRVLELPESIYKPIEYNDRLVLIRRLIRECEKLRYQMLQPEAQIAGVDICLYSGIQDGYLLIPTVQGDRIFLEIRESGLLNAFRDYFKNLDEKYIYTVEETVSILKSLLKKPL